MAKSFQIDLPDGEQEKLIYRIEQDFLLAKDAHMGWANKCAAWMRKWEAMIEPTRQQDEGKPNHVVPLVQWQTFAKLARDVQALIGENAEITARATGPSDRAKVAKIGRWMTSRLFDQMQILSPLCEFEFRRILNGWAGAYRPWYRREFDALEQGKRVRVCDYEGPGFFPLEVDHLVTPPERSVRSVQDFTFVIRRVPYTIDELQRGDGTLFRGTADREFVRQAINWAQSGASANDYTLLSRDPVLAEREKSEGVNYEGYQEGRRTIWIWEWYGKWRRLKSKRDADVLDLESREQYESDLVIPFVPGMRKIIGCRDLLELYPRMRRRRPFVESTLIKDGTYRPKGFGALLSDLEDDATSNSRLFAAAGELSVWPIVFFKPGGGFRPKTMVLEPRMAIATEDPQSVNVVHLNPSLDFAVARNQEILATAERVTNINDQSLGRAVDRPNAPRTATGQLALIEEGNVRAYLDATILREDMESIIQELWELDCNLVPQTQPGLFFRVTEEQAGGLFNVRQGGAYMTPGEFAGKFDFRLKFATSVYARQNKKAEFLAFYQACMANPIVASNPTALWNLLNMLAKEFEIDFQDIVPKPPEPDRPRTPDEEWTLVLEGESVQVNPGDHDDLHIQQHIMQLEDERKNPTRDTGAIGQMVEHILAHQQQKRVKALMQAMTAQLMQQVQQQPTPPEQQTVQQLAAMFQGGGGQPGMQQPGMPQQPGAPPPNGMPQPGAPPPPAGPPQQIPGMGQAYGDEGSIQFGGPNSVAPYAGSSAAPDAQEGML